MMMSLQSKSARTMTFGQKGVIDPTGGQVLLVLDGELVTELRDGRRFTLRPGTSDEVGDGNGAHRSATASGAWLFIVG
jgi:hypothetical protein